MMKALVPLAFSFFGIWISASAQIPQIADVPSTIANPMHRELLTIRADLVKKRDQLHQEVEFHNIKCANVAAGTPADAECAKEQTRLDAERKKYIATVERFNQRVRNTVTGDKAVNTAVAPAVDNRIFPEKAADLVHIFDIVSDSLNLPKGPANNRERSTNNCQDFFRGVAKVLGQKGEASWEKDFPGMNADQIVKAIDQASNSGKKWQKIRSNNPGEMAQALANKGVIVVGGSLADKTGHGHLGFVFPVTADLDATKFPGKGPFVRDGNEHSGRIYASTYGAIKASNAFGESPTSWYIWVPSNN